MRHVEKFLYVDLLTDPHCTLDDIVSDNDKFQLGRWLVVDKNLNVNLQIDGDILFSVVSFCLYAAV